jgi:hypothetical protein
MSLAVNRHSNWLIHSIFRIYPDPTHPCQIPSDRAPPLAYLASCHVQVEERQKRTPLTTWTHINDADMAVALLPAWFTTRMLGTRGSYGFLLTTGDVVRVSRVTAIHMSSEGAILVDVLLDHAGVPGGVDMAWQTKHFLGVPVPAANLATLNLAHVIIAIEFTAAELAETADNAGSLISDAATIDPSVVTGPMVQGDTERIV